MRAFGVLAYLILATIFGLATAFIYAVSLLDTGQPSTSGILLMAPFAAVSVGCIIRVVKLVQEDRKSKKG